MDINKNTLCNNDLKTIMSVFILALTIFLILSLAVFGMITNNDEILKEVTVLAKYGFLFILLAAGGKTVIGLINHTNNN